MCRTLLQGPTSLSFKAVGSGEASFNLDIRFVPAYTFALPVFYGLLVQKRLSLLLNNGTVVPITNMSIPLPPGTLVQVDIEVTLEDDQPGGIILNDILPAPFQAHDPNLPQPQQTGDTKQHLKVAAAVDGEEQPPPPPPPPPSPGPSSAPPFDPYSWYPNVSLLMTTSHSQDPNTRKYARGP